MKKFEFAAPDLHAVGAGNTSMEHNNAIMKLARATISLSQIAPRLGTLAAQRQEVAQRQAEQMRQSADVVRNMTLTLEQTMQQLQLSTSEIAQLTTMINRIADETRIISINAGIVAAQAGDEGRTFAVLAKEIRALSENTADATRDVHGKVKRLEESTVKTVRTVGLQEQRDASDELGLGWLLAQMEMADASAVQQVGEAQELNTLGNTLRALSEDMIGAVGTFRLALHERIEALLEATRIDSKLLSGDLSRQQQCLRQLVDRHAWIELAYITDTNGIQTIENVSRSKFQAAYGASGKARDWSDRDWFKGALHTDGVHLTAVYRSKATDEFCLTASTTFAGGAPGVVAVDIRFSELLDATR